VPEVPPTGVRPRVLVVDDDAIILRLIRQALTDAGFQVDTALDGEEALALARIQSPDLVVLDITLPRSDSAQIAAQLRALKEHLPILVITGDGAAAEKARLVSAFDYVRKPFELDALLSAVVRGLDGPMAF